MTQLGSDIPTTMPVGRTEREVAADVIAMLLEAKVLRNDPVFIAQACFATGVPVDSVRKAAQIQGWKRAPIATAPVREGEPIKETPRPTPAAAKPDEQSVEPEKPKAPAHPHNARQKAKKEPVEGVRICAKCGPQPKTAFSPKDSSGKLRWLCNACYRKHQKARYLSVKRMERLGVTLSLILALDDDLVGQVCPKCKKSCDVGQEVVATHVEVRHSSCSGQ